MDYDRDWFLDDITFCVAECHTPCFRKPSNIRCPDRFHSYANFSSSCSAYDPIVEFDEETDI